MGRDDRPRDTNVDFLLRQNTYWLFLFVKEMRKMTAAVDRLTTEVARNTSVDQSAIVLLNGLADQIRALKDDPVKLAALADELSGSSSQLAEAVTRNTPAEEPAPPEG